MMMLSSKIVPGLFELIKVFTPTTCPPLTVLLDELLMSVQGVVDWGVVKSSLFFSRAEPDKKEKTFINDTIRSEFHKKFMDKYIK